MSTILEHSLGQEDSLPWPEQVQWQASKAPIKVTSMLQFVVAKFWSSQYSLKNSVGVLHH